MNIVMLAAGTSSRMGKTNKMLIPVDGMAMVAKSCLNALEYLQGCEEKSCLIVVTGYRHLSLHKALKPCRDFIEKTNGRIEFIEVFNPLYKQGQFTSAKAGVKNVADKQPFFISLADMPFADSANYSLLAENLNGYDAVRPFFNSNPGHPVLLGQAMKAKLLKASNKMSVAKVLETCNVNNLNVEGTSWTADIDSPNDKVSLLDQGCLQ